jgi:hypothetical protein
MEQATGARRTGPTATDLQGSLLFFPVNTGEIQVIYRDGQLPRHRIGPPATKKPRRFFNSACNSNCGFSPTPFSPVWQKTSCQDSSTRRLTIAATPHSA